MQRRSARVPTRERILDEVERLIASKGVHGFKLRDVAERLGLRVPAIYKHYRGRDDVLVEVSHRFVALLAAQFRASATRAPSTALRSSLNRLVDLHVSHPAYVRLALADFAAPAGGSDYVKQAAAGSFRGNFSAGPLAAMHLRLRALLRAGARVGDFRRVNSTDFFRVVQSALLIHLVFPDDRLLLRRVTALQLRSMQRWLWDVASGFLAPRRAVPLSGGHRRPGNLAIAMALDRGCRRSADC
jgi:AcrR family transcriptional regulator